MFFCLKKRGKMRMRDQKIIRFAGFCALFLLVSIPFVSALEQSMEAIPEKAEQDAPKSELDKLKAEWEAVREQQIQMIREKEEQLEKFKEELFAKLKEVNPPIAPQAVPILPVDTASAASLVDPAEFELQKAAFQADREKFFREMNREKENLRLLQISLDEKARQLEENRARFERQKTAAV
jgi:hypothetical protein